MKLFGSAINFFGGIVECNHKKFVKDTGFNTQKRIRTFTLQVATRYYEVMTLQIAKKCLDQGQKATTTSVNYLNRVTNQPGESMTLDSFVEYLSMLRHNSINVE